MNDEIFVRKTKEELDEMIADIKETLRLCNEQDEAIQELISSNRGFGLSLLTAGVMVVAFLTVIALL